MSNSGTPIGENGRKELKVSKTEDADKLLDKYFEDLSKEGYGKIQIRALAFDVPEVSIKSKGGDEQEEHNSLSDVINVLTSGKKDILLEELINGAKASAKSADLKKVKAKTEKLKEKRLKERSEKEESSQENKTDKNDKTR